MDMLNSSMMVRELEGRKEGRKEGRRVFEERTQNELNEDMVIQNGIGSCTEPLILFLCDRDKNKFPPLTTLIWILRFSEDNIHTI